jgi:hypothetical protein
VKPKFRGSLANDAAEPDAGETPGGDAATDAAGDGGAVGAAGGDAAAGDAGAAAGEGAAGAALETVGCADAALGLPGAPPWSAS